MENVRSSLIACSSIHIVDFLNERKQKLGDFSINAYADRNKNPPHSFTEIKIEYLVKGKELNENAIKEAGQSQRESTGPLEVFLKTAKIKSTYLINKE